MLKSKPPPPAGMDQKYPQKGANAQQREVGKGVAPALPEKTNRRGNCRREAECRQEDACKNQILTEKGPFCKGRPQKSF
jgi:hypothetical protein